ALGCSEREIVFTSGGTESDLLAVRGLAPEGSRVVVSSVEHPAVFGACEGREVVRIGVDGDGLLDVAALANALPGAALCSIMAANNETGVLSPLEEIAGLCRRNGVLLHTDAVQAAGKMPLPLEHADLISLSAHKIGGPKGAGLLWIRNGLALRALQPGGHQERGRRGGTENVAGIVGLAEALWVAAASLPEAAARPSASRCGAAPPRRRSTRCAGSFRTWSNGAARGPTAASGGAALLPSGRRSSGCRCCCLAIRPRPATG